MLLTINIIEFVLNFGSHRFIKAWEFSIWHRFPLGLGKCEISASSLRFNRDCLAGQENTVRWKRKCACRRCFRWFAHSRHLVARCSFSSASYAHHTSPGPLPFALPSPFARPFALRPALPPLVRPAPVSLSPCLTLGYSLSGARCSFLRLLLAIFENIFFPKQTAHFSSGLRIFMFSRRSNSRS